MRLDYRKLSTLLKDAPSLAGVIELEKIPHFSTFQKAAAWLLVLRRAQRLFGRNYPSGHGPSSDAKKRGVSRHRWHRLRVSTHQRLLRPATQSDL